MKADNILGIDYGDRALGLALVRGDERPVPFATLTNNESTLQQLKEIIESNNVSELVVGWPRNLEGESTIQTTKAENFATQLEALKLPVVLQDEAVTSELAQSRLPRKISVREAKNLTHQYAAVIILEDYLANQA